MDVIKSTQGSQGGNVMEAGAVRTELGAVAQVGLFQEGFAPTAYSVDADFVAHVCDFDGYNEVTVAVWDPVGVEAASPVAFFTNGTSLFFQKTAGATGNNVGGAWLRHQTAAGPPAVYEAVEFVVFDPPVPMNTALAALNMEWKLRFPGPGEVSYSY